MQAFHNDPKVKAFYVERLQEHHRLDQIISGVGWNGTSGCNVGCILHKYDHEAYPQELGLPAWYAHLCDAIFENLPGDKRPAFAMATLTSITEGVDIEPVRWKLAIERHTKSLELLASNTEAYAEQCRIAIRKVIDYATAMLAGTGTYSQQSAAWSAANSVAQSTRSSQLEASEATRSAAYSVESADWASASSADRAANAAGSAWSYHYIWEAGTLVRLLLECTPSK